MGLFYPVILAAIALVTVVVVVWRAGSRRHELPCPAWLRWMVELDNPFTRAARAQTIVECLDLEPGMSVLDAGCGPGRVAIPMAKRIGPEGRVVAVDLQRGMLLRAKQKAQAEGLSNILLLQTRLGQGALGRNRFDRAVLVTVLGEIPDRARALKEIADTLKPGGMLSVAETVFDPHYQRRGTVSRLAVEAGLVPAESFGDRLSYAMNFKKPLDGDRAMPLGGSLDVPL